MKQETLHQWCRAATAKIRYKPDRKQVYEELMAHLEDKCADLREQGCPEEEVERRAVEAMGDAGEIAPQLGALHRPFWGYVYSIVKWAAVMAVVLTLCFALVEWRFNLFKTELFYSFSNQEEGYFTQTEEGGAERVYYTRPGQTCYSDGCFFTLTDAALWDPGWTGHYNEESDGLTLYFRLRELHSLEIGFYDLHLWLQIEDNLGNCYDYDVEWISSGPVSACLDFAVPDMAREGLEWVKISYTLDGRDISFYIDLTEVGA